MRKLFTILAAALFSVSMMAQTTIFSATPLQTLTENFSVATNTSVEITDSWATIVGGTLTADNKHKNANNFIMNIGGKVGYGFSLLQTATGLIIELNEAIQEGDVISVQAYTNGAGEDNGRGIFVTTATARPSSANCTLLGVSETAKEFVLVEHTVKSTDDICGQSTIYLWRATGNSTYFKDFAITRPAPSTDPVAEVTISGKTACYNGKTITLEATTDVKADDYKWTVNGDEQTGEETNSFEFAPTIDGTYSIVCYAKNEYNSDWIASATHSVVVTTKPVQTELVPVNGDITWDFDDATTAQVDGNSQDTVIYFNLDAEWADGFAADKLAGKAQFFYRGESYQAFQGYVLKFVTTVPGKVKVTYSNTGGSRAYRYVRVNGVQSANGTASATKIESEEFAVNAGVVNIDFNLPDPADPQEKEGGAEQAGLTQCRVYKVVFTKSGETALDNTEVAEKAMKVVENGQLYIRRGEKVYTVTGAEVK